LANRDGTRFNEIDFSKFFMFMHFQHL
jgi:hypothetical protein